MKKYFLKRVLVLNGFRLPVGTALNGFSISKNKYGASTVLVKFNSKVFRIRRKNLIEFDMGNVHTSRVFQVEKNLLD